MTKTVLESKFTEIKGLNRIEHIVNEMKCLFRVIHQDDYGIDGEIEVVVAKSSGNGYETKGGIIKVQAKAGRSYVKKDKADSFATPVRIDDLEYWNSLPFPVFFIVYHPNDDVLYFKEVQTYIRETIDVFATPYEIVFDKANDLFGSETRDAVYEQANNSPPRISFDQKEQLFSNLFKVKSLPTRMTVAKTTRSVFSSLRKKIEGYCPPFFLYEKKLFTLSDLNDPDNELRDYCKTTTIETIENQQLGVWISEPENRRNFVFLLNQLMGSHLWRCGLRYNKDFKRNYFPRLNETSKEFKKQWISPRSKRKDIRTVAKYYEYGTKNVFSFWRHLAAEFSFQQFGENWFFEVKPKYLFTIDGRQPCDSDLVGPYTTSQKAKDRNIQVLNHVLFFGQFLAQKRNQIEMKVFDEVVLTIEPTPITSVANFALPLDPAVLEDDGPEHQLSLFGWVDDEAFEEPSDEH